jgi:glycine/D-amino acid oxidase-like deaminating enzyme
MTDSVPDQTAAEPEPQRLSFDLDVEVCVIGGGLAGLSVALEAARLGASVAILERERVAWAASSQHIGRVMPGFDVSPAEIIGRIGRKAAAELWRMSATGAEIVRAHAAEMPDMALSHGALEVSGGGAGDRRLDAIEELGSEFGYDVRRWPLDHVRETLRTMSYFEGLHHPRAFQVNPAGYAAGLASLARAAGVRIFEQTPVTALDVAGARKRITTPRARMRAGHVILAGNVHVGDALPRLGATLLPVWRSGVVTAPLGERLAESIGYSGSVADLDGVDHFRVLAGDRLMWSSLRSRWQEKPERSNKAMQRRIAGIFPSLGMVPIERSFGGAIGRTVHGMPQIGQLRPGVWVASGFGYRGVAPTAMAGRLIARAILWNDDRYRMFDGFDLVWTGGRTGRTVNAFLDTLTRSRAAIAATLARRAEARDAKQRRERQRRAALVASATSRESESDQRLKG